jgi:hypothetical protein
MIETLKDMKHGKSGSYESLALERTASQILHRMQDKESEDSLESTRTRVLGMYSYDPVCRDCASGPGRLTLHSERARDLWTKSMSRSDKLRPDFLKKGGSLHRRAQSGH